MHMHSLNWLAILVAAISTMVVGFLWYSPLLFAKPWMKEMGYDPNDKAKTEEMKKTLARRMAGPFFAALLPHLPLPCFSTAVGEWTFLSALVVASLSCSGL